MTGSLSRHRASALLSTALQLFVGEGGGVVGKSSGLEGFASGGIGGSGKALTPVGAEDSSPSDSSESSRE